MFSGASRGDRSSCRGKNASRARAVSSPKGTGPEPVDVTRQAQQAVAEAPEDALVDKAEQERFSLQRQRNALQTQLCHAVEAEDFESAAKLRDQLKALPQQ